MPEELAGRIEAAAAEPPGNAANGKKLFSESRCITCHTVEGKGNGSAPELSKIASAATRGWLLAFLRDPHAFNPRTRMPRYRFCEAESRDVVAYLEDEFRDFDAPKDILEPLRVNQTLAENGGKLFRHYGCFACHDPAGSASERFGPDLDGIGDKRAASLDFGRRADLAAHAAGVARREAGGSALLRRRAEDAVLRLQRRGLARRRHGPSLARRADRCPSVPLRAAADAGAAARRAGRQLIDRYRCLSCHQIGDRGGDISTAPLTYEGSKVRRDWLVDYLVLSYSIRPILEERMPVFRMPREEATQLADALRELLRRSGDPRGSVRRPSGVGRRPVEGQRLYVALGAAPATSSARRAATTGRR